jgi:hypothetical protein
MDLGWSGSIEKGLIQRIRNGAAMKLKNKLSKPSYVLFFFVLSVIYPSFGGEPKRTTDNVQRSPVTISRQALADEAFWRCLGEKPGDFRALVESEPYAAVNPRDPKNIVAAWQTRGNKGGAAQVSVSFDGGRTWSAPKTLPVNACAGGRYPELKAASDPWVSFSTDGRVYVGAIGYTPSELGPDLANGIIITTSPDGGRTWERPAAAALSFTPYRWHDNEAITAHPGFPGTAYVLTTRYEYPALKDTKKGEVPKLGKEAGSTISFGPAAFSKTSDGGRTWSKVKTITPLVEGGRVSAPQMVIDPRDSRLYAIYYNDDEVANYGGENKKRADSRGAAISFVESGDKGETWSKQKDIAHFVRVPGNKHPLSGETVVQAEDILQASIDPKSGMIFVAFADGRFYDGKKLGIALTYSGDEGRTWMTPIPVSSPEEQTAWLPGIAVNDEGMVGVVYMSSDFNPGERKTVPVSVKLKTFAVQNGKPVHRTAELVDRFNYGWPGDYLVLLAIGSEFHIVYGRSNYGESEPMPKERKDGYDRKAMDIVFR